MVIFSKDDEHSFFFPQEKKRNEQVYFLEFFRRMNENGRFFSVIFQPFFLTIFPKRKRHNRINQIVDMTIDM
jgi:hypothetical protein